MANRFVELCDVLLLVLPETHKARRVLEKEKSDSFYIPPECQGECWASLAHHLAILPQTMEEPAMILVYNYFSELAKKEHEEKKAERDRWLEENKARFPGS